MIEARERIFGQRKNEVLIPGDIFKMEWIKEVDSGLPTLLVVSGVFQYFYEKEIVEFIRGCAKAFYEDEMIFDSTSKSELRFTNWFIKRTGNPEALMYFGINDSKIFADKCGAKLLEKRTFFPDALRILGKKFNFITKICMKIAEKKKQVFILHLKLNPLSAFAKTKMVKNDER